MDLLNIEKFRKPLKLYIQNKFSGYANKQMLMFGLTHDDLIDGIMKKVLQIKVDFEYTYDPKDNPTGVYDAERHEIIISSINPKKYEKTTGYEGYVDSVVFHELVHAVDYIKKLYDKVTYNGMEAGAQYYLDPEEMRAYQAQIKYFLQGFLGLSPRKSMSLMQRYTTDRDTKRGEYLKYVVGFKDWIEWRKGIRPVDN